MAEGSRAGMIAAMEIENPDKSLRIERASCMLLGFRVANKKTGWRDQKGYKFGMNRS